MAFHRERVEEELRAEGMSAEHAHHAARRQFGNDLHLREKSHDVVAFRVESILQDVRFALRQLWTNPGTAQPGRPSRRRSPVKVAQAFILACVGFDFVGQSPPPAAGPLGPA